MLLYSEKIIYAMCVLSLIFFKLYAFILLTSTLVPGINYFVVTSLICAGLIRVEL